MAAATVIGLGLVYFHVVLAQRQFALDRLQTEISQAQSTYQAERLKVAELSAPQHIISEAEGRLGMTQPQTVTYLSPSSGSAVAPSGVPPLGAGPPSSVVPADEAPAGDADWPVIKSELAGQP
jgi:hypothetical protein